MKIIEKKRHQNNKYISHQGIFCSIQCYLNSKKLKRINNLTFLLIWERNCTELVALDFCQRYKDVFWWYKINSLFWTLPMEMKDFNSKGGTCLNFFCAKKQDYINRLKIAKYTKVCILIFSKSLMKICIIKWIEANISCNSSRY